MNRNQSRRQGTEVPGEHLLCSNVAAGVYRFFFQMQVIVVRSNAAREAELNCTVSLNHFIPSCYCRSSWKAHLRFTELNDFFNMCIGLLKP